MVWEYLAWLVYFAVFGVGNLVLFCEINGCDPNSAEFMGLGDAIPGGPNGAN